MQSVTIGDRFIVKGLENDDIGLSFLVINHHPDNKDLLLVVPVDDQFWVGVFDVLDTKEHVFHGVVQAANVARPKFSNWIPKQQFAEAHKVEEDRADWAERVRKVLAAMARGKEPEHDHHTAGGAEQRISVENDHEYEHFEDDVLRLANLFAFANGE